jgi:transcription termination factor Rho
MSPRAKKTTDDAAAADTAGSAETAKTAPRRGRKAAAVVTDAATDAPTAAATSDATPAPAPKRRGRPPGSKNAKPTGDAATGAESQAVDAPRPSDAPDAQRQSGADGAERDPGENEGRGSRGRRGRRGGGGDDGESAAAESGQGDSGDPGDPGDDGGEDREGDDGRSQTGRSQQRGRRNRGGQRKGGLNFRDLQGKIVPELHLLAKEVGLESYREMPQDELVIAVLERSTEAEGLRLVSGYLEISSDGYGFLQESLLKQTTRSVIVSAGLIKQFRLRTGDVIMGKARRPRDNERYGTLIRVEAVNGFDPFQAAKRPRFDDLVPTFPDRRITLEIGQNDLSARVIDLLAPIGRGQRGLIVAPPKAGKTTLLKAIAKSAVTNEPDITVIVLLVDERPEEVTDFRESVEGVEVVASTFDEPPANHIRVAEFVHERARRIVEDGGHVMILLDSITRLARANNLVTPATGRTLSGGLDSNALHWPKRFLGAARNIRGGGSLSILATALVETGSRMDDVIFEEFKGTGNMELHLSRRLEERRIFPAIDILKSGTRREDLLLSEDVLAKMWLLRKVISDMDAAEAMEMLLSRLNRTKSNAEFLSTLGQG